MPTTGDVRIMRYASEERCDASDELCHRVHRLEPTLPIHPPFEPARATPCILDTSVCLPAVYVLSGWHMLAEDGIQPWFQQHPSAAVENEAGCFNMWRRDDEAVRWVQSWRATPNNATVYKVATECSLKMLTWHPEYAGRYWTAGVEAYERCRTGRTGGTPDSSCEVLNSHGDAIGRGGIAKEATPPFVLRALYGSRVKLVAALRSPGESAGLERIPGIPGIPGRSARTPSFDRTSPEIESRLCSGSPRDSVLVPQAILGRVRAQRARFGRIRRAAGEGVPAVRGVARAAALRFPIREARCGTGSGILAL